VVVSILIAFSLDAWWNSWNDRREEASPLRSLVSDFEKNREQLDLSIQGSEAILGELFALERLSSQSSFSQAQLDSVPNLLDGLYRWLTYNPITSTLDAAISTGSIGLIRNDLLRGELVGWPRALDDSAEQEVWLSRMILGYNRPFLNGRVLLPHGPAGLKSGPIDTTLLPELLTDVEFRNLLTYQIDLLFWATGDKQGLKEDLVRILDLLKEEVGTGV